MNVDVKPFPTLDKFHPAIKGVMERLQRIIWDDLEGGSWGAEDENEELIAQIAPTWTADQRVFSVSVIDGFLLGGNDDAAFSFKITFNKHGVSIYLDETGCTYSFLNQKVFASFDPPFPLAPGGAFYYPEDVPTPCLMTPEKEKEVVEFLNRLCLTIEFEINSEALKSKQLIATILEVKTTPMTLGDQEETIHSFTVLEFHNGLILLPEDITNDSFFEDRDSIEACGTDTVLSVEDTGETETWTAEELIDSIKGSMKEFGVDSVPKKHSELWR